ETGSLELDDTRAGNRGAGTCVSGEGQVLNYRMISLLFSGLLVAILTGRGIEPAEITEEPVSQENPDVYAKTTEESMQAHETSRAATADPSPASLRPDDTDDTEPDDYDSANNSSSGDGEEEEDDSLSGRPSNTNQDGKKKQKTIPSDIKEGVALAVCDPETPPTPLFEDDIPSVLELEVEDLQKLPEKTNTVESTSDSGEDS
ncbi:hypothetical protein GJAV_G00166370, partial [Gymnothorax javanicus]